MPDDANTLDPLKSRALFAGLVFDEQGRAVDVGPVGGVDHYVIDDDGFKRHVPAHTVDDEVLDLFQSQVAASKGEIVQAMLEMMGKDDIFTKTALDSSVENLADAVRRSDPTQWTTMLGLAGFRIVVDYHGQVIDVQQPAMEGPED